MLGFDVMPHALRCVTMVTAKKHGAGHLNITFRCYDTDTVCTYSSGVPGRRRGRVAARSNNHAPSAGEVSAFRRTGVSVSDAANVMNTGFSVTFTRESKSGLV